MICRQEVWDIWTTKKVAAYCVTAAWQLHRGIALIIVVSAHLGKATHELGKSSKRKQINFEDKKTYRWYEGMQEVNKRIGATLT